MSDEIGPGSKMDVRLDGGEIKCFDCPEKGMKFPTKMSDRVRDHYLRHFPYNRRDVLAAHLFNLERSPKN